jgi:hypothetical protein
VHAYRRTLFIVAAAFGAALAVIVVRLLVDSHAAFVRGQAAENRGELTQAIRHYQTAARLYVPGSPYVKHSILRLDVIAVSAIQKSNYSLGRTALEAERAALLGTRSLFIPMANRLPEIERRLSRLLAATEDPNLDPGASFETRSKWHLERLERRPGPRGSYVLMAVFGFGIWIASAVFFLRKALDTNLRLRPRPAMVTSTAFLLGLAIFLVGLRLA